LHVPSSLLFNPYIYRHINFRRRGITQKKAYKINILLGSFIRYVDMVTDSFLPEMDKQKYFKTTKISEYKNCPSAKEMQYIYIKATQWPDAFLRKNMV
jgi:hypothetical protein